MTGPHLTPECIDFDWIGHVIEVNATAGCVLLDVDRGEGRAHGAYRVWPALEDKPEIREQLIEGIIIRAAGYTDGDGDRIATTVEIINRKEQPMAAKINDDQAKEIGKILQRIGCCHVKLSDPDERRTVKLYTQVGPNHPVILHAIGDDGLTATEERFVGRITSTEGVVEGTGDSPFAEAPIEEIGRRRPKPQVQRRWVEEELAAHGFVYHIEHMLNSGGQSFTTKATSVRHRVEVVTDAYADEDDTKAHVAEACREAVGPNPSGS